VADRIFDPAPVVVGHRGFGRGLSSGHAENTIGSYLAAIDAGVTWIEVDVTRSRDDDLVVIHNPATSDGIFVTDQTAAELAGKGVPRFVDVLAAIPPSVGVNIDVKTSLEDARAPAPSSTFGLLAPVLRAHRERRPLLASSFDAGALVYLRTETPGVPLGLIGWVRFPLRMAVSAAAHLGFDAVCAHWESFGPNTIESGPVHRSPEYSIGVAHDAGLEVLGWCPDAQATTALVEAGIDAVCVNDVPGVLAALRGAR
jgi:glycerophosphoryl diester phosphodiesterase